MHTLWIICVTIGLVRYTHNTNQRQKHPPTYPSRDYSLTLADITELSNNKYTCLYVWANKNSKPNVINDTTYFRSILLVLAGVEQNPGPRTPKYACAICSKDCKWSQKALACDECDHWYHATCTGIDTLEYVDLANTSVSWHCVVCNTCNYSTVLYDLLDSADSNTYSVLSSNQSYASASDSLMSSPGHPQAASSPKPNKPKASPSKRQQSSLRILIINFQSIKNKRNDLQVLLESTRPDVILGTESWLSDKIHSKEIFPDSLGFNTMEG